MVFLLTMSLQQCRLFGDIVKLCQALAVPIKSASCALHPCRHEHLEILQLTVASWHT